MQAVPRPRREFRRARLNVRISESLLEDLRWAVESDNGNVSFLVTWLLKSGLDRLDEIGLEGIIREYWHRRGPCRCPEINLAGMIDERRREAKRPVLALMPGSHATMTPNRHD